MKAKIGLIISFVFAMGLLAGCASGGSTSSAASSAADTAASSAAASSEAASSAAASSKPAAAASSAATSSAAASSQLDKELATAEAILEAVDKYWDNFPAEGNNQLPADKIFEKIDAGEDMYILDIRSAEDYAKEHLKGAVNIPYAQIGENLTAIPDDKPIWINCYTGQTSSQTTVLLSMLGKDAHNVQGGWKGISGTEGYENYVETTENTFPAGTYEVDPNLATVVEEYYAASQNEPYKNYNFPPEELGTMVEKGDTSYTILDVRAAKDYDEGHIAGAINIPFGKGMHEELVLVDSTKPVVVNCYSGNTSSQVVATMRMLDYEAYNLNGGMGKEGGSGWLGAGLPVVSTADEQGAAASSAA